MIRIVNILLVVLSACLTVCCGVKNEPNNDLFTTLDYTPKEATGFAIYTDSEGNKLLSVTRPWQGESPEVQTLAIFTSEEAARGYRGTSHAGLFMRHACRR